VRDLDEAPLGVSFGAARHRRVYTGGSMKKIRVHRAAALGLLLALAAPLAAQRGDDAQRKSKNGRATGKVAGVTVVVEYGRPSVNGRAIWGALVPYGQVWRTGADEATTISFDQDVAVEGQPLAAGTYALFTIPGETEWTVIFNKTAKQWGAFKYDAAQDALRVKVEPVAHENVEALDFVVEGDAVVLRWEKLAVPIRIAAAG
jgi:hypothetical protein